MSRLACALLAALACGALPAQSFSTLEERMSGREFREAGLEKLSSAELSALNAWLQRELGRSGQGPAPASTAPDRTGFQGGPEGEVVSTIPGEFTGWSRGTRFELENGQVWEVTDGGSFVARLSNPTVRIRPGSFGSFFLSVPGYNTQARVKRIR